MAASGRLTIQTIVGLICAILAFVAIYQAGGPDWSYSLTELIAMIVIIAILLDRHEFLIKFVGAWRGGGDGEAQQLIDEALSSFAGPEGGTDAGEGADGDGDSGVDREASGGTGGSGEHGRDETR